MQVNIASWKITPVEKAINYFESAEVSFHAWVTVLHKLNMRELK